MRKLALALALSAAVALPATTAVAGNGNAPGNENPNAAVRYDDYGSRLGTLDFLGNNSGFHLWFTVEAGTALANNALYTVGNSYHNVYKWADQIGEIVPGEWCNDVAIAFPDREPYNLGGGVPTAGTRDVHYKIWDDTAQVWVCGHDS